VAVIAEKLNGKWVPINEWLWMRYILAESG
jgi:hypothetical protein